MNFIDDHELVREGLSTLVESSQVPIGRVVYCGESPVDAAAASPVVALLDVDLGARFCNVTPEAALVALRSEGRTPLTIDEGVSVLLMLFASVWIMGATLLTTYGVTHVQASRAAVVQVVELMVAMVSAVLIGGESLPRVVEQREEEGP